MSRLHLLGNLPRIGKGRLDRAKVAEQVNFTLKGIYKVYNNWIQIFQRQSKSTLTFEEYLLKMKEAGITPEQIGYSLDKYQLARFNDEGPYTKDSCRFITSEENKKEQIIVPVHIAMVKKYGYEAMIEYCKSGGKKGGPKNKGKPKSVKHKQALRDSLKRYYNRKSNA